MTQREPMETTKPKELLPMTDDVKKLMHMLCYMRPAGSKAEDAFVERFLTPLGFVRDNHRNLVLRIDKPDGTKSPIMWSSHMDTVHRKSGLQTVHYDRTNGDIVLSKRALRRGSNCLGADCTAGVWLMAEMVKARVPGTYVIHHAEEIGAHGSSGLAKNGHWSFFDGLDFCIAFDRYGFTDVITYQGWGRTASDDFADSFAKIMNMGEDSGMMYSASEDGIFTDSANYSSIISECTNIAVGYSGHHTPSEKLSAPFIVHLRDLLIRRDFSGLVTKRDPNEIDDYYSSRYYGGGSNYYSGSYGQSSGGNRSSYPNDGAMSRTNKSNPDNSKKGTLAEYVKSYPGVAHSILNAYGVTLEDFKLEMEAYYGIEIH